MEVPNEGFRDLIHFRYMLDCIPAVGPAFCSVCSTSGACEVSVVHHEMHPHGCKAVKNFSSGESREIRIVLLVVVHLFAFVH